MIRRCEGAPLTETVNCYIVEVAGGKLNRLNTFVGRVPCGRGLRPTHTVVVLVRALRCGCLHLLDPEFLYIARGVRNDVGLPNHFALLQGERRMS
jgi:hypothetical protein